MEGVAHESKRLVEVANFSVLKIDAYQLENQPESTCLLVNHWYFECIGNNTKQLFVTFLKPVFYRIFTIDLFFHFQEKFNDQRNNTQRINVGIELYSLFGSYKEINAAKPDAGCKYEYDEDGGEYEFKAFL